MATAKQLLHRLEEHLKAIETHKQKIDDLTLDVERLSQPDVWKVGDRVRLKEYYASTERGRNSNGWRHCLHFMTPYNIATIVEINVYNQKISYVIRFDNQECFFTMPRLISEIQGYIETGLFSFKPNELIKVNEKPRYFRTHCINEKSTEIDVEHRRLKFKTSMYRTKDWCYVRSKDPVSYVADERRYLYYPLTEKQFNTWYQICKDTSIIDNG